jgi:hypothetical protein
MEAEMKSRLKDRFRRPYGGPADEVRHGRVRHYDPEAGIGSIVDTKGGIVMIRRAVLEAQRIKSLADDELITYKVKFLEDDGKSPCAYDIASDPNPPK